jgi:hypothetical protein
MKNVETLVAPLSESDIRDTIQDIPVGMACFRVEADSRFVQCASNRVVRTLLQTDEDQHRGRTILELKFTSSKRLQVLQKVAEACVTSQQRQSFEGFTTLRDGSRLYTNYGMTPLIENHSVTYILCSIRDEQDEWLPVEQYVSHNAFHRPQKHLCPACTDAHK